MLIKLLRGLVRIPQKRGIGIQFERGFCLWLARIPRKRDVVRRWILDTGLITRFPMRISPREAPQRRILIPALCVAACVILPLANNASARQQASGGATAAPPGQAVNVAQIDHERILKLAAAALRLEPPTITRHRATLSLGGLNDFFSTSDYFWPNPATSNGLPFISRDGQSYPELFAAHRMAMRDMRDGVSALAAAYLITHEDRYVSKASQLLRVFFVDPATKMNPNLQFAQAVPGASPGRSYGIIDGLHLIEVPRAITAMASSPALSPDTRAALKTWFADLSHWMLTSANGKAEASAKNNHSVAFFLQIAVYADFTGNEALQAECRRQFKEVFVGKQMAEDGSFPLELKRTKPYGYSIFQLDNMATLCQVLSTPQDNLWLFQLPDGRGMRKAMAFLYPFLEDKTKWPFAKDIQAWSEWPARQPALLFAGLALQEEKYLQLWRRLSADPADPEVRRNMGVTQPILWLPAR